MTYQSENEGITPSTKSEVLFSLICILLLLYTAIYVILTVILVSNTHLNT